MSTPSYHLCKIARSRVLVVDEEAVHEDDLAQTLARHHVVTVRNGEDAFTLLSKGERFDLILFNIALPDMNGAELLARLKADHPIQAERAVLMVDGVIPPVVRGLLDGSSRFSSPRPLRSGVRDLRVDAVVAPRSRVA